MLTPKRIRQSDVNLSAYIRRLDWFTNSSGSFWGKVHQPGIYLADYGELPEKRHSSVDDANYIIYSYMTPIAWHVPNVGWFVPALNYGTQTTAKHQNITRFGVGVIAGEKHEKIFTD